MDYDQKLEALLREIPELVEAAVRRVLEERFGRARKQVDFSKALLSRAEAARILGIDKKTTLRDLIAAGHIATVQGTRGVRIRRAEVERLVESGIPKVGARVRRLRKPKKGPPPKDVAAHILGIKL